MTCPDCKDEKPLAVGLTANQTIPCYRCEGSGSVPEEMVEWIRMGREMLNRRVHGNRTLREEAARRGLDMSTLSKMEMGKMKPMPE